MALLKNERQSIATETNEQSKIDREYVSELICDFIESYGDEMTTDEKRKVIKNLDYLIMKFRRKRTEYMDLAEDCDKWDSLSCMEFVFFDLFRVWYDRLASSLGMERYDEKEKREQEEYEAARSEVEVKKEDCDDGLPF